ncbi:hypothetical protein [Butyrivibrio sp.]|uniref:hypothetical protein n=1 Tax=Butyrivibrio sp. TaxID=28121 RepID=UPI0025BAE9F0|nr:hypothetical protein [Butyrivibrio sp.]MBE5837181.1 hypothetical protein [Butyrivibrio sp.]
MNKYKSIDSYNIIIVFLATLLACSISILGGELDYAGNDDAFRNLVSVGAFGPMYNYYIPFSNILYGIPIALFNRLFPLINWYYWTMIVLSMISIASLCVILFYRHSKIIAFLGSFLINIIFSRDYYVAVQFTKTASLWIACGIGLVFISMRNRDKCWILGTILFLFGAGSRMDCLYMMMPFIMAFCAIFFLMNRKKLKKENILIFAVRTLVLVLTVVVLLASEMVFRAINPEWNEYWSYNSASAYLRDHMSINYDHDPERYEKIKTGYNDIELYNQWIFGDLDFYNRGWLYDVIDIERKHNNNQINLNLSTLKETVVNLTNAHERIPGLSKLILVSAFCLILLLFLLGNKYSKLYALFNVFCVYTIYWYFTCVNRFMWRAECGTYVAVIVFSIVYICISENEKSIIRYINGEKAKKLLIIAGSIAVIVFIWNNIYEWRYTKEKSIVAHEADITGRLYSFLSDKDNFYMLTDFYVTNNPVSITRAKYGSIFENSAYLGNWIFPSPDSLYYCTQRGIKNPMKALVDDKVYLHCSNSEVAEMIRRHLCKCLSKNLELIQVDDELWDIKEIYVIKE